MSGDEGERKLDAAFAFIGEQHVKNIVKPVRAWRVGKGAVARAAAPEPLPIAAKPSVAVLAFENMSGARARRPAGTSTAS